MHMDTGPELTLPDDEAGILRKRYATARVILEYGSGGSTWVAGMQAGKFVMSVESDRMFALRLQSRVDAAGLPSPVVIHHADIGPTGDWGRAIDDSEWRKYCNYPFSIWAEPYFRDPDIIFIDGRFRAACLSAAVIKTRKPVTVLFDDYYTRPAYRSVEKVIKPTQRIGRMAEFRLIPGNNVSLAAEKLPYFLTKATFSSISPDYSKTY